MRVGKAAASKRRRAQRLRALQRSMDSDSEDDMPLVSTGPEVFAMLSDIGDTVVDEPTPQDVLEALEQDLCQIEVEDQPIATRIDSEDDLLVEEPLRENGPGPPVEGDVQREDESDTGSVVHNRPQRRRLILNFARDRDSSGEAEMEHQERIDTVEEPQDVLFVPHARTTTAGFASLNEVDLAEVFLCDEIHPEVHAWCISWGMKLSLQEIQRGSAANNSIVETPGWKLFFLLPRLLLFTPLRGGLVPRGKLQERMSKFASGEWELLFRLSLESSLQGISANCKRRRRQRDTVASRVSRAIRLAN